MSIKDRVYDARYDFDTDHALDVTEDEDGMLALVAINDEDVATVKLDAAGAKKLRLVLQRFERKQS